MSLKRSPEFKVLKPPVRPNVQQPSVILYGSFETDPLTPWRDVLASSLSDMPIAVLNPTRDEYSDPSWFAADISHAPFREQVEWEMDHATVADVIAFYFVPGSVGPIALLELGLHAGKGKCVVCCPEGYHRRGNVQIVCARYGIEMVNSVDELGQRVRERLVKKLEDNNNS